MLGPRLDDVLATFRTRALSLITTIEGQLASGDLAAARSTAHQLKSAAGSVGAARLAEQAGAVEQCAQRGDGPAATQAAALLPAVAAATLTAITSVASPPDSARPPIPVRRLPLPRGVALQDVLQHRQAHRLGQVVVHPR